MLQEELARRQEEEERLVLYMVVWCGVLLCGLYHVLVN